jgi:hypothetical protein
MMKRNFGAKLYYEVEGFEPPDCPFCLQKNPPKKTPLDPYGDHLCSCKKGGGVVNTHDAVRDLTAAALHQARIPFTKESPIAMTEEYGKPTWKADLRLPKGLTGNTSHQECALDITITNPIVKTQIKKAGKSSDSATVSGEKTKHNDVGKHLPSNIHFVPVSLSVFGAVGDASRPFFNYLLTQLAYQTKTPFHEVASSFWVTQSILLQRFKAQTIFQALLTLERTRTPKPSDIRSEHPLSDIISAVI